MYINLNLMLGIFGEGGNQLTIDQLEHIQDAFEDKK